MARSPLICIDMTALSTSYCAARLALVSVVETPMARPIMPMANSTTKSASGTTPTTGRV